MNRMHIAMFTNTYLPFTNGITRSVNSFRQAMVDSLGHNVFIFAQGSTDYEDKEPFIYRYPSLDIPFQKYPLTIPISHFASKLMPTLKLDVIHSHHPAPMGTVAADFARKLKLPLVFTHHTRYQEYTHYIALPEETSRLVIERWIADYMQQCQHIIVPSESIRRMIEDTYGIRDQMTVIPTGIDTRPYQVADGRQIRQKQGWGDDTVLISVGRMAEEKNWPTLLEAVNIVFARQDKCRLVLLGDGPAKHDLEKYTRKLGIADRVTFTGNVPFAEIPDYLSAADLFCFASVTETQGLVTMEAMAAGLPAVAVAASGTSDILEHDKEGLLTSNDSQALANGILQVLSNKENYGRYHEAALKKAAQFDIVHLAQKTIEVYQEAAEAKKAGLMMQMNEKKPIFKIQWRKYFYLDKIEEKITELQNKIVRADE